MKRRISIPMSYQGIACNQHQDIWLRYSTLKRVHRIIPDLIQHTQNCHRSTMSNVTLKHTPGQKTGTTDYTVQQFNVCIGSRAPHFRTVLQNGQDKTPKHAPISDLSWNTGQDFLKIPSLEKLLWKLSEDAYQRTSLNQMSFPIY